MRQCLLLVLLKIKTLRNGWRFKSYKKNRGYLLLCTLGVLFFIGDYIFFNRILTHIKSLPLSVGDLIIPQFLMVICLTFFSMLAFSNIVASISTLYLSKDLDLLISSPINLKSLYSARLLQTVLNSSSMFFVFAVPIFLALGKSWSAEPIFYIAIFLAVIPFIVIPGTIGVIITTFLMRFFPARKTHQFLTIISLLFMGGMVLFIRLLEPERILGKREVPIELIEEYINGLQIPSYAFLPSTWLAKTLHAGIGRNYDEMWQWISISWGFAVIAVLVSLAVASRYYYTGWSISYAGRSSEKRIKPSFFYTLLEGFLKFTGRPLRAVLLKDMKLFWRDPSQWTQIFILGALVFIYIFNIRKLPMETVILKNFISVMNIGLSAVVISAIGVRFLFPTTSVEGQSFWLIKTAPVDFKGYLWGKFFFYLFPLILLSETLVIVSNFFLEVDGYLMAISAGGIFFLTIGITGLGIGFGAIYPVFDHDNIAELATSTGAIYYMLISLSYIGLVVIFGVRPVYVHFSQKFMGENVGGAEVYICYAIVFALTLVVTYLPITKGITSLKENEV